MRHLFKFNKKYTMKEEIDGFKTTRASPLKYSVEDKYAKYRREVTYN